ncbi:MAG: pectic acid lyase [Planctomycetales bacterium]|nr:pectic acid lyase [Planctomycetales bacterium]
MTSATHTGRLQLSWICIWSVAISSLVIGNIRAATAADELKKAALATAKQATAFLTDRVSTEGGYLWRYSSDLTLKEGEGVVTTQTVWVQPPGTPSVGEAFVHLYEATDDTQFLDAARAVGEALRRGQMRSGGWQAMIEFEPDLRAKWAYRTNSTLSPRAKDQSTLDDDKTQSAIRFVIQLDRALQFKDAQVHEMAIYSLDGLLQNGQLPNGGFPQVWTDKKIGHDEDSGLRASFPETWSREYHGHGEYWYRYTLNDNLAPDVLDTLFLAAEVYGDSRYSDAALTLADFLLLAQLPEPQPAWAQQYSFDMQPIWARKFEPPAVTGGESQGVIETLFAAYRYTGDKKYLAPIPRAIEYLEKSKLPDGRLARFYELRTNRPLYFTKDYQLTYDDSDIPAHYSFKTVSRLDRLRQEYNTLVQPDALKRVPVRSRRFASDLSPDQKQIQTIISSTDDRGAWVTNSGLRYHKAKGEVIDMRVAVANLRALAQFLSQ